MQTFDEQMRDAFRAAGASLFPTLTGRIQDGESMPDLTDEIKEFIVNALACYDTPSYVAEAVNVNFGVRVSRQQVYRYDPKCSQPPAQRWRDLHAATRSAFLRDVGEIAIANKMVRLRILDRLTHRCERNSVALAIACLERAAKECGGIYENRRPVVMQLSTTLQPAMPESPESRPSLPEGRPAAMVTAIRFPQPPNLTTVVDAQPLNANQP